MRRIGKLEVENCVRFIRIGDRCVMKAHISSWAYCDSYVAVTLMGMESPLHFITEDTKKLRDFLEECMLLGGY